VDLLYFGHFPSSRCLLCSFRPGARWFLGCGSLGTSSVLLSELGSFAFPLFFLQASPFFAFFACVVGGNLQAEVPKDELEALLERGKTAEAPAVEDMLADIDETLLN
jgi:hypothetical protein